MNSNQPPTGHGQHPDCEEIQILISEQVDEPLSIEEQERVREHTARCQECRTFQTRLEQTLASYFRLLGTNPRAPAPSEEFTRRILDRVSGMSSSSPTQEKETRPPRIRILHRWLIPLAIAASLLILSTTVYFLTLEPIAVVTGGSSGLVAHRAGNEIQWIISGDHLNPGDRFYVLPGHHADLTLADGGELRIAGDTLLEFTSSAGSPRLLTGCLLARMVKEKTAVETPDSIVLAGPGDFFLQVTTPDPAQEPGTLLDVYTGGGCALVRSEKSEHSLGSHSAFRFHPDGTSTPRKEADRLRLAQKLRGGEHPVRIQPLPGDTVETTIRRVLTLQTVPAACHAVTVIDRMKIESLLDQLQQFLGRAGPDLPPSLRIVMIRTLRKNRPSWHVPASSMDSASLAEIRTPTSPSSNDNECNSRQGDSISRDSPKETQEVDTEAVVKASLARLSCLRDSILQKNTRAAVQEVEKLLTSSPHTAVRLKALSILVDLREPASETILIHLLKDPEKSIRLITLRQFGRTFHSRALDARAKAAILAIARDDSVDAEERAMAIKTLGRRCGQEMRAFFRSLIQNPRTRPEEKIHAINALGSWGDDSTANFLKNQYASHSGQPEVQRSMIPAYGKTTADPTAGWLLDRLQESNSRTIPCVVVGVNRWRKRGGKFSAHDLARLEQFVLHSTEFLNLSPGMHSPLIRLIFESLQDENRYRFLAEVQSICPPVDTLAVINLISQRKDPEGVQLLLDILEREGESPDAVSRAISVLGNIGIAMPAIHEKMRNMHQAMVEKDPRYELHSTRNLASALFLVTRDETLLQLFKQWILQEDLKKASCALRDIHLALGPRAVPVLLELKTSAGPVSRLNIARSLLKNGIQDNHHAMVHRWWQEEKDPWTRFTLAFVQVNHDRHPTILAIDRLDRDMPLFHRNALARSLKLKSTEDLRNLLLSPAGLPRNFSSRVLRFITNKMVPGAKTLLNR